MLMVVIVTKEAIVCLNEENKDWNPPLKFGRIRAS